MVAAAVAAIVVEEMTIAVLVTAAWVHGALAAALPLPALRSESVAVRFADTKQVLILKNADVVRPIASVTKLLSGLILTGTDTASTADSLLAFAGEREGASAPELGLSGPMSTGSSSTSQSSTTAQSAASVLSSSTAAELVTISEADKDRLKWSRSRLKVGYRFRWADLLSAALGASDNRAMYASVRAKGWARELFVERMNQLAHVLGMDQSRFKDPAGIDPGNVSTAHDLLKLIDAAAGREAIRQITLRTEFTLSDPDPKKHELVLHNPNRLARSAEWQLVLGKTGYTVEAGRGLVLRAVIGNRPVDMVFLGAREMASVFGDAARVKRWLLDKVLVADLRGS
jgi:D-alanyl-D-alanine endopeptidase (penicillin-binding protein 7)